jgi:hypothetical protein
MCYEDFNRAEECFIIQDNLYHPLLDVLIQS